MECEYKQFGCAVVLPRKEVEGHVQTSMQEHLQMTTKKVKEQEIRLQKMEELEARLKKVEAALARLVTK